VEHSFGNWVRRRRKALDLTQQELAIKVGCSNSPIFKAEWNFEVQGLPLPVRDQPEELEASSAAMSFIQRALQARVSFTLSDDDRPPELAIELSRLAPATVVGGSSMFPRDRVISSLIKYNIPFDESESTESLRDSLAVFYAQRTLTKSPITLADQAEIAYLLSSNKFSKTTGQILSVDGGLQEAFLR
jgi:transcriptional regulator with XRE-family HTH domain